MTGQHIVHEHRAAAVYIACGRLVLQYWPPRAEVRNVGKLDPTEFPAGQEKERGRSRSQFCRHLRGAVASLTAMDDQRGYAHLMATLEGVMKEITAANAAVTAVRSSSPRVSAEVDAVTMLLADLKVTTKNAHAALAKVHTGQRSWPQIVSWTLVLLALPAAFVSSLELFGSSASGFADDCEGVSALTCFINVSILVWACAHVVRHKILPSWWPRTHGALPAARRNKAIGYAVKTLFRLVVLVLLLCLLPYWSLQDGLRMGGGPVAPTMNASGTLATLAAGSSHNYCVGSHGVARRLWHSCKMFFMAIMCWELSFLPAASWDVWVHHIGLILGVAVSTDHRLREVLSGGAAIEMPTGAGESLDGFAYVLMLGTAFMFAKEALVVAFQHRKLSKTAQQANDLLAAAAVHVLGLLALHRALPCHPLAFSSPSLNLSSPPLRRASPPFAFPRRRPPSTHSSAARPYPSQASSRSTWSCLSCTLCPRSPPATCRCCRAAPSSSLYSPYSMCSRRTSSRSLSR